MFALRIGSEPWKEDNEDRGAMDQPYHQPVMVREVIDLLQPRPGDTVIDCNLGTGGHSLALLEACQGKGLLVGLDRDDAMLSIARARFLSSCFSPDSLKFIHADFARLARIAGDLGLKRVDRILMDLGASSLHFDESDRGFSCTVDGILDMRYDRTAGQTAADIVNTWSEKDLARLFWSKADERWSRQIARHIARRRTRQPFRRTGDLATEVAAAIPRRAWPPKIHPATRVFLALRVEVNNEVESLQQGLTDALSLLAPGGRFAVITFQSHEDRAVKQAFRAACADEIDQADPWGRVSKKAEFRDLTRKPIVPGEKEIAENPRARSAKLRGIERIENQEASTREHRDRKQEETTP